MTGISIATVNFGKIKTESREDLEDNRSPALRRKVAPIPQESISGLAWTAKEDVEAVNDLTRCLDSDSSENVTTYSFSSDGRSKSKYLCPPYFILIAGLVEIFVYVLGSEDLERMFMYDPHQRQEVWRFITYMLLHYGLIHLTLNIIIQTIIATPLEMEQGWLRCAAIYLGGGLMGSFGASVIQPQLCMVGASAGVYALLTSHIANVIVDYSSIKYKKSRLFSVAVLAFSDISYSFAHHYSESLNSPKIGWSAHCAGAFAGITLGLIVYTGEDKNTTRIKTLKWTSIFLLILATAATVIFNIFSTDL